MTKPTPNYRYFLGIDVSKATLDLYLYDSKARQGNACRLDNDHQGFARMHTWLRQHRARPANTLICSEHTGRYGEHLNVWLGESPWQHGLLKTTAVARVSPEHHRKNDSYDAQLIAEFAQRYTDKIQINQVLPPDMRLLDRLRRERRRMVDKRASYKQKRSEMHYHAIQNTELREIYTSIIKTFTQHIRRLDACIKKLITGHPQLNELNQRLCSISGIGPVIACQWICLFYQQDHLNARKISSRFGFAPHEVESGTTVRKRKRSTRHGNGELRRMLSLAARSVIQHKQHFREYYNRKRDQGKPHLLIVNNVINKLIRTMCTIWNRKSVYDPHFNLQKS